MKLSLLFGLATVLSLSTSTSVEAQEKLADAAVHPSTPPFTSWTVKSGTPKVVLLLVHGFGLHKGAFDSFAKRMQKEQIASYAVDVRGFGDWHESQGTSEKKSKKAFQSNRLHFEQSLVDIGSALIWIRKMHPKVPVVILGESMGGAFALQATVMYPQLLNGLVASVPSHEFFGKSKAFAKVLMQSLAPNEQFDLAPQLVERATVDRKLQDTWKKDTRAHLAISPKDMLKFQLFIRKTEELAPQIADKPVLMLHGTRDRLAKQSGTIELFNSLRTADKDLVMVGSAEHLIFELGQFDDHTFNIVLSWLKQHYCAPAKAS
ncbi:MAG: lysophospholipase [Candidatus Obscuribacterales bacterium]|nr:lysophospholipase [Candidatus Obscuribacterales bacterium]